MKDQIKKSADIEKKLKEKFLKIKDIVLSNERDVVKIDLINGILGNITDEFLDIHRKSLTDELTGFVNRWFLNDFLRKEIRLCRRYDRVMTLAILDIDYLKQINDTFGHKGGDEALIKISKIIKKSIRDSDVVVRYGGDEFVIVFPMTDLKEAKKILSRMKLLISKEKVEEMALSVSAGLAKLSASHKFAENLIDKADKELYKVKKKKTLSKFSIG